MTDDASTSHAVTGTQVAMLRRLVELPVASFAEMIGATAPTVYRWEASGEAILRISPFQIRLLSVLRQVLEAKSSSQRSDFVRALHDAIDRGGALRGLYVLLRSAFHRPVP